METKICTKCLLEKNINEYGKHTTTKDKLQCRCLQCIRIDKKEFYQKNKEKINSDTKKYRKNNNEKLIEYFNLVDMDYSNMSVSELIYDHPLVPTPEYSRENIIAFR